MNLLKAVENFHGSCFGRSFFADNVDVDASSGCVAW